MPVESDADRRNVSAAAWSRSHGSDIVQLIATGMCFGVALTTLIMFIRERRST